MIATRWAATALAVAATALTPAAFADEGAPAPAAVVASAAAVASASAPAAPPALPSPPGTPLVLRPSKPLQLAEEPAHAGIGWKLGALVAVLGGAFFYAKRKWSPSVTADSQLTIVRRATIGFRSELLVVNVEGQRLLLGVTPHSIQSLALLDGDEASVPATASLSSASSASSAAAAPAASTGSLGDRFAAMLDAADRPAPRTRAATKEAAARIARPDPLEDGDAEPEVGSQARGLLALRRPR